MLVRVCVCVSTRVQAFVSQCRKCQLHDADLKLWGEYLLYNTYVSARLQVYLKQQYKLQSKTSEAKQPNTLGKAALLIQPVFFLNNK